MKIVIVDYGMGNISSIVSAFRYLDYKNIVVTNDFNLLESADKLILPGVGNYARAIAKIRDLQLDRKINELVTSRKKAILGICLGMQLLGKSSSESGFNTGLGLIDGVVEKIKDPKFKVPHVGYDQVMPCAQSRLYKNIGLSPDFYFTHSYRMTSVSSIGQSCCQYGEKFIASFELDNIAGVQFHPELSQKNGIQLLKNFIELFGC